MSYELQAAVAAAPLIAEMARRFQRAVAVPLNQGLALIPASGSWLGEVTQPGEGRPFPAFDLLSWSLAGFLREASVRGPVVYLEIEETQDLTFEAAVGWSGGELALPPRVLRPGEARPPGGGPVVEAFRLLDVAGEPGQDDWASFGLYQFSHMEQWLEVPGLIQRLPEMELVWTQPEEAWAGFDFKTDYQTWAGRHPFRLRVGAGPGASRFTVSFWQRAVLELDHLPVGWRLKKGRLSEPDLVRGGHEPRRRSQPGAVDGVTIRSTTGRRPSPFPILPGGLARG